MALPILFSVLSSTAANAGECAPLRVWSVTVPNILRRRIGRDDQDGRRTVARAVPCAIIASMPGFDPDSASIVVPSLVDRFVVINAFDRVNLIRPFEGIGIFQSAYGPRFTVYDSLTIRL